MRTFTLLQVEEARMSEPRPTRPTPEMAMNAARILVTRLVQYGLIECDEDEDCAADIAKYGRQGMDGYALAKELDNRCYWDCDLQMADELDAFAWLLRQEIENAQRAWVEQHGITAPLPEGSRVVIRTGETGTIDRVYEHGPAQFCIAIDGDDKAGPPHHARRIVNFEDVTEIAHK